MNEAKQRLGTDAGPSELARVAQSVKAAHTNGERALDTSTFQSSEVAQPGVSAHVRLVMSQSEHVTLRL